MAVKKDKNKSAIVPSRDLRIFLVDDNPIFLTSLERLLQTKKGLQIVGKTTQPRETVLLLRAASADVVMVDIRMPELNGFALLRMLHAEYPDLSLIAMSLDDRPDYAKTAAASGAVAFVRKDELVDKGVPLLYNLLANKKT